MLQIEQHHVVVLNQRIVLSVGRWSQLDADLTMKRPVDLAVKGHGQQRIDVILKMMLISSCAVMSK